MSTQLGERWLGICGDATRGYVLRLAQTHTAWGNVLTMQFSVCVCVSVANSLTRSPTNPPFVLPRAGSMLKRRGQEHVDTTRGALCGDAG